MKDLEMIISREDLEKNRRRILKNDKRKVKAAKKEKALNILGIILFYIFIIVGTLLIDWRMDQIEDQKNTTAVYTVAMNESVN